jgi:Predicted sugar phosphatases of the HAD superfamily
MRKLSDIELFLFDMDGTVYLGDTEIEGSFDAIRALRAVGKRICFFTNNSSKSADDYIEKLKRMGLDITRDEIYTSGEVTCEYINERYKKPKVFVLGNEKLRAEFLRHGISLSEEDPDLCVLGFDTSLEYNRLYRFCGELFKGKPYIATHPDMFCPTENCPMPDIGGMILLIEATINRRPDVIIGKPYTPAGDGVKKRFNLPADKIAMVGDRIYTDILFGKNNGFASVLVLSGETSLKMLNDSDAQPDFVFDKVKDILAEI